MVASVLGNGSADQTVKYPGNIQATHAQIADKQGNALMVRVRTVFPQ